MIARSARPKLTLSTAPATAQAPRPSLALMAPVTPRRAPLSPRSPLPVSPTAVNTRLNQRGFTTMQQPTYAYANNSTSRSILKKGQSATFPARRQLQFSENTLVYCVTPIEEDDYYGSHGKMSREERRWQSRA